MPQDELVWVEELRRSFAELLRKHEALEADATRLAFHPIGTILAWSPPAGSSATPPAGWLVCDGTNQTPNLVGRFLFGVASVAEARAPGGATQHGHRVTGHVEGRTAHSEGRTYNWGHIDNKAPAATGTDHKHDIPRLDLVEGTASAVEQLPPYDTVVYIIRVA